jgi:hypothetical protein
VGSTALLVGLKLVLQPAATWLLATRVFGLPPLLTHTAVLLAALPTGAGPFLLAEFDRREAGITSTVALARPSCRWRRSAPTSPCRDSDPAALGRALCVTMIFVALRQGAEIKGDERPGGLRPSSV